MVFTIGPQSVLVVFTDRHEVNGGIVCRQYFARTITAHRSEFHSGKLLKPGEHVDVMVRGQKKPVRLTNKSGRLESAPIK
jgi:hypothetical protein